MQVGYTVAASEPGSHLFDVTLRVDGVTEGPLELALPAWIPGSYMVRDYARHVVSLSARDDSGEALAVNKTDKSTWLVAVASAGGITVALRVYAWDLSVRGAHLDDTHAYFNGTCLFPRVTGHPGAITLDIEAPAGLSEAAWVATSLRAEGVDARGFGRYVVDDYAELIDHPVEIAEQQCIEFEAAGLPHRFIVRGANELDAPRLAADLEKICAAQHELLGTPDDLDRYTFLAYALPGGYGGLEHRWSSSLVVDRDALPAPGVASSGDGYRDLLGLISHEYFHLWNVRRLKPAVLSPPDLSGEVHTGLLWVFEGITSYYDDLMLVRSGAIDVESYLEVVGRTLTRVLRTPGRLVQSLEDSSFDAWTKFYKQDENAANAIVSYYAKGAIVALALDLKLRAESDTTLDAVMRECWRRYYREGEGMPERGLEPVAAELSGLDLGGFFEGAIRGTDDVDLAALLRPFGVTLNLRAAAGKDDKGGKSADKLPKSWCGIGMDPRDSARIARVLNGSPAAVAGVSAGDRLVAIDATRCNSGRLETLLQRRAPGDALRVTVFRGDQLREFSVTLVAPPADTAWLTRDKAVDAAVRQRFADWLQPPKA
ncbi:MAG: PDZ domain-containing protein [Pseudomonadota bacterium]